MVCELKCWFPQAPCVSWKPVSLVAIWEGSVCLAAAPVGDKSKKLCSDEGSGLWKFRWSFFIFSSPFTALNGDLCHVCIQASANEEV